MEVKLREAHLPLDERLRTIAVSLQGDDTPNTCDLANLGVSDEDVQKYLGPGLSKNITLSRLYLQGNKLGKIGVLQIFESLSTNLRLVELNLSDNPIGPDGLKAIALLLPKNDGLHTLRLARTNLTGAAASEISIAAAGLQNFGAALRIHPTLHVLDIAGNCLTDFGESEQGFQNLLEGICGSRSLSSLDLSHNDLGASGAKLVVEVLRSFPDAPIDDLLLASNRIQTDGAKHVACLLADQSARAIRRLDLRNNDLSKKGTDNTGLIALASALQRRPDDQNGNKSLWSLDLRENHLTCSDIDLFVKALCWNCTLVDFKAEPPQCSCKILHSAAESLIKERMATNEAATRALSNQAAFDPKERAAIVRRAIRCGAMLTLNRLLDIDEQTASLDEIHLIEDTLAIHSPKSRRTPLHDAVHCKNGDALDILLRHQNPVNATDREARTPLHTAAAEDELGIALLLVEHGASIFPKDRHNKLPGQMFSQVWMQNELLCAASRLDAVVLCGTDTADIRFAARLAHHLHNDHDLKVSFVTPDDQTSLDLFKNPNLRSAVLLVIMSEASAASRYFRGLVKQARKVCGGGSSAKCSTIVPALPFLCIQCSNELGPAVLSDPLFLEAEGTFNLSIWAELSVEHWRKIDIFSQQNLAGKVQDTKSSSRDEFNNDKIRVTETLRKKSVLREASQRRFRPTLLQTLQGAWPSPQPGVVDDLAQKVRTLGQSLRKEMRQRIAKSLNLDRHEWELRKLVSSHVSFIAIIYIQKSHTAKQAALETASELQKANLQTWSCPTTIGCHDNILQTGLTAACAVFIIRETSSQAEEDTALDTIEKFVGPGRAFPVLSHRGQCYTPLNGHALVAQLGELGIEVTPRYRTVSELEARQNLEYELHQQRKALQIRQDLCRDLVLQARRYEQRFRQALSILNPVQAKRKLSAPQTRIRDLEKELLRLRSSGLQDDEQVAVPETIRDTVHLYSDGILREALQNDGSCALTMGELKHALTKELEFARQTSAAVRVQAAWRGCYARELRRRAARVAAAVRIQRAFRAYRQRSSAWMILQW